MFLAAEAVGFLLVNHKTMVNAPKGWVTDTHPAEQPENTYRYALNAVREIDGAEQGLVINEKGTTPCGVRFPGEVMGQLYLSDNEFVVFVAPDEVGVVKDCAYTTILKDSCLNIVTTVDATYRVRNGCERYVYYTDGVNPPRVINLDDPACENLIGEDLPITATVSLQTGGTLTQGAYQVAIRYMDEDQNPSNWSFYAGPLVVFSGNTWITANGEFNPDARPADNIPNSNKSIRVSVSSPVKPFYQIALGVSDGASGSIDRVLLSRATPSTQTTVISGNFTSWTEGLIEDVFVDRAVVATAKHIDQIENRLVLANVTENERAYCDYQATVNQIAVRPFLKTIPSRGFVEGNARHPDQSQMGYMGDEVYMFGIVYIYNDGSQSPVFNIPGRAPIVGLDTVPLTVVTTPANATQIALSEVEHLGVALGETVATWQVRNTGSTTRMAYWEGTDKYPTTNNCSGTDFVWGPLAGLNIRGHKFPSRDLVPHTRTRQNFIWGVEFDSVVYPDPDIVGHFFVRALVDTPTIVGTGYLAPTWRGNAGTIYTGDLGQEPADLNAFTLDNKNQVAVISPEILFNQSLSADYQTHYFYVEQEGREATDTIPIVNGFGTQFDLTHNFRYVRFDDTATPVTYRNFSVDEQFTLEIREDRTVSGTPYTNYSYNIPFGIQTLNAATPYGFWDYAPNYYTSRYVYAAFKRVVDPFPSLSGLTYQRISGTLTGPLNQCFGGDTFISSISILNVARLVNRRDVFNSLREITQQGTLVSDLFFECRFNTSLNYRSTVDRTLLYFNPSDTYLTGSPPSPDYWNEGRQFLFEVSIDVQENGDYNYLEPSDYVYEFNSDMTVTQRLKEYFPLPQSYECCAKCLGRYPFRVVYSNQSFQEEGADNFRVFLPNNYRDIEGMSGEITDIIRYDNILYVITQDAIWYLPSNIQERTNDAGIVSFLGSGEFFALPPRKVADIGNIEKWSTITTPAGILIVDSLHGRVYMLGQELTPMAGIDADLRRITGPTLNDLFLLDPTYQIGTISAYDDQYRRILITHKDYKPLIPIGGRTEGRTGTNLNTLYYDTVTRKFYVYYEDFGPMAVSLNSSSIFCNRSWTISYSLAGGWVGYHSYVPQVYLAGKKQLYMVNDNHLVLHNTGDFCVYFGTEYPHALEQVFKTKGVDSVNFITYAEENGVNQRFTTFDRAVIYNSHQATQERVLIPRDQIGYESYLQNAAILTWLLDNTDEVFSVNGFRDEVGNYNVPLFVTDCIDLTQSDKLLNPLAFTGKEWYEVQPFMDNYVQVRFIFSPHPKTKLSTLIFNIGYETKSRSRGF